MGNSENVFFCILAGGGGTRLWPLSRDHKPKQFLDVGETNLIEQSITRLKGYPQFDATKLILSTEAKFKKPIESLIEKLALKNEITVVADPSRRETGPAVLLNVLEVLKKNSEATIAFLPADPFIPVSQNRDFVDALQIAIARVEQEPNKIVFLGKTPTYPATGFGYIETFFERDATMLQVESFKEKPDQKQAEEFISRGNYFWNMGILVGKAQFFAQLFEHYTPRIYGPVSKYLRSQNPADFNETEHVSVNIAISQPASKDEHLLMVPVTFDWLDVGDVNTYLNLVSKTPLIYEHNPGANNNKVFTREGKLVALVGVSGLCIVDTSDALLIIPCDQAQKVKDVVETLKADKNLKKFIE